MFVLREFVKVVVCTHRMHVKYVVPGCLNITCLVCVVRESNKKKKSQQEGS